MKYQKALGDPATKSGAHSFQDIMNDMCGMDIYLGQCSKLHQIVK